MIVRASDVTCPVCHAPAGVRCERVVGDPAIEITTHLRRSTEAARRTYEANVRDAARMAHDAAQTRAGDS